MGIPEFRLNAFGERLAWATAAGVMVTLSNLGADYAAGKLTAARVVYRLTSLPLLVFVSATLAARLGFTAELNGVVAIVVFLVGRNGLEYFANSAASKWLGVPPPPPMSFTPPAVAPVINTVAEPTTEAPPPTAAQVAPFIAMAARLGSDEMARTKPTDPDADIIERLANK
jgi:hypothetical protein